MCFDYNYRAIEKYRSPSLMDSFVLGSTKSEHGHKSCKLCKVNGWLLTLISAELHASSNVNQQVKPEPHMQVLKSVKLYT